LFSIYDASNTLWEGFNKMSKSEKQTIRILDCTTNVVLAIALITFGLGAVAASNTASPETVIRATTVSEDGALSAKEDPSAAIWNRVPEELVELNLAFPVHQSIVLLQASASHVGGTLPLRVSVITDRQRIYFRLRWKDKTLNDQQKINAFADSAAVEIPFTAADTSPIMGSPDNPVSIWRWNAVSNDAEALIAGSPGTLTKGKSAGLHARGVYRSLKDPEKNEWLVVISQDLDEAIDGRTNLRLRRTLPAAFAIWQGSERQRGGFKHVSNWVSVQLPPEK
jgi:DMSO reductase family type II enzyme heme b subunit